MTTEPERAGAGQYRRLNATPPSPRRPAGRGSNYVSRLQSQLMSYRGELRVLGAVFGTAPEVGAWFSGRRHKSGSLTQ